MGLFQRVNMKFRLYRDCVEFAILIALVLSSQMGSVGGRLLNKVTGKRYTDLLTAQLGSPLTLLIQGTGDGRLDCSVRTTRIRLKARMLRPRWTKVVKPHGTAIVPHEVHHPITFSTPDENGPFAGWLTTPGDVDRSTTAIDVAERDLLTAVLTYVHNVFLEDALSSKTIIADPELRRLHNVRKPCATIKSHRMPKSARPTRRVRCSCGNCGSISPAVDCAERRGADLDHTHVVHLLIGIQGDGLADFQALDVDAPVGIHRFRDALDVALEAGERCLRIGLGMDQRRQAKLAQVSISMQFGSVPHFSSC